MSIWKQLGKDIDGESEGDYSGYSVSLSDDGLTVAIGSIGNAGQVRVYKFLNGFWVKLGRDIYGEAVGDQSGFSVSLSGDGLTVAIGAIFNAGSGTYPGQVRVYKFLNGSWDKLGQDIDGEASIDQSGYSVSLSADGTTVAIGAIDNDGNGTSSGQVRVYQYSRTSWTQLGGDIDGEVAGDQSGWSVSLSKDKAGITRVAIGAPKNDGSESDAGHVRVYKYSGTSWIKESGDINGEDGGDQSGSSVSLSADGTTVAIGAPYNDGNGTNSGQVRVYKYSRTSWTQLGDDIDGEAAGNQSGSSVSLSADGTTVAIGSFINTSYRGQVRVYKLENSLTRPILKDFIFSTNIVSDSFKLAAPKSDSPGLFSYTSSNLLVATILGDIVTIIGPGKAIITATQEAAGNFTGGTITANIIVFERIKNLSLLEILNNEVIFGDFIDEGITLIKSKYPIISEVLILYFKRLGVDESKLRTKLRELITSRYCILKI